MVLTTFTVVFVIYVVSVASGAVEGSANLEVGGAMMALFAASILFVDVALKAAVRAAPFGLNMPIAPVRPVSTTLLPEIYQ